MRHVVAEIKLLLFAGVFVFLFSYLYSQIKLRANVSRIFSKPSADKINYTMIEEALKLINEESPQLMFTLDRVAKVSFQGQILSLVDGRIGGVCASKLGPTWGVGRSIFAIADLDQSKWMQNNTKVFKPVFLGKTFSVFGVKLAAI